MNDHTHETFKTILDSLLVVDEKPEPRLPSRSTREKMHQRWIETRPIPSEAFKARQRKLGELMKRGLTWKEASERIDGEQPNA